MRLSIRFWFTVSAAVLTIAGCQKDASSNADPHEQAEAPPADRADPEAEAKPIAGPALAGPHGSVAPSDLADKGPQLAADDDENKDYWAAINFNYANFEEVREYVKTYYIDAKVDESRAFAEAANFALHELDPPRELLPVTFYDKRKGHKEEEGRLDGKTSRLKKGDPFLIHSIPEPKEEKDKEVKRLNDDEIRDLRKQSEARRALLGQSWENVEFKEQKFRQVMDYVKVELEKQNRRPAKNKNKDKDKKAKPKTMKHMYVAAAQGYLYSLDPHSSLVSAEAWDESTQRTTDNSFEGIGAILTQRNNETIVESPIEGRPAHQAGVRAGDVITHVDKQAIGGLPLHKVVSKIRGKQGTTVTLTIRREGDPNDHQVPIERAHIDIKNVSGHLLEPHHPGVAYVKVTGFVPTTTSELEKLIADLKAENKKLHDGADLRGIVLDLRGNSGGLLQQGVKVADMFVEDGVIVEVRNRIRKEEVYRASRRGTVNIPLITLINDGSASASEIVASAIQDNGEGLLVGDRTFGKASVQTLFTPILRKDYYIKLTIARYFSPAGTTIQVVGVKPDFEVPPEVGGKMPLGFREENLSHYLKPLDTTHKSANEKVAIKVKDCAEIRGIAEKIHANDPNPQIKFDYQLMKAADYMECYIDIRDREEKAAQR